jgi:hypothetical protein
VDEEELAPEEEEEEPKDDIKGDMPYATYADANNLGDSTNNMNNLANSLRDNTDYMAPYFSTCSQSWAPSYYEPLPPQRSLGFELAKAQA